MVTGTDKTHIHTDEDEATSRRQAEVAAVDQAMDMVADDMPVLSGSATSSSKAENRFGQRAAQGLKQSSTAADAGTCISTTPPPSPPGIPPAKATMPLTARLDKEMHEQMQVKLHQIIASWSCCQCLQYFPLLLLLHLILLHSAAALADVSGVMASSLCIVNNALAEVAWSSPLSAWHRCCCQCCHAHPQRHHLLLIVTSMTW